MFTFDDQPSASALMDELERFMVYWAGSRRPEYDESEESLSRRRLPLPLRRLYAFAGRWPPVNGLYRRENFGVEDYLRSLASLEEEDGKLVFLDESQAIWRCATSLDGDDPPVWCDAEYLRTRTGIAEKWNLVSDSLATFLVQYCLYELLLGSLFSSTDEELVELFRSERQNAVRILSAGTYISPDRTSSYYLYRNRILVAECGD